MKFQEAVVYLLSLGNEVSAMKQGLENIRRLLAALDNPQDSYLKVQVAGTNGKGSVCAFLDSICRAAKIETGLYTSPHLISITERIKINGREIGEEDFARLATRVRETAEKLVKTGELANIPTFFEQVTAIALLAFAEAKLELAILETGLGGRLDAITATNAEIVAITQIDIDHQEYLGETLAEIAAEKAAIIRAGVRVYVAPQKPEAARVIDGRCREVGVEAVWVKDDYKIRNDDPAYPFLYTRFRTRKDIYNVMLLDMQGRHQFTNAALALHVAEGLESFGLTVPPESIEGGLSSAKHPGRLERWGNFLFDGAHNVGGVKALCEYLDEFVKQPITIIFGIMEGKDVAKIAPLLFPKADTLILTQPKNSRAMNPGDIARFVPDSFDTRNLIISESVSEAVSKASETPVRTILVTGSLYLVGEAQGLLRKEQNSAGNS